MTIRFAIFFAWIHLHAFETDLSYESSLTATMAGDPSSLVDGKVSAITGAPAVGSIDLTIQGYEPIHLTRYYLPGKEVDWNLAWDFAKAYEVPDTSYRWVVCERGEAPLVYKIDGPVNIGKIQYIRYSASKLNKGLSNTATGQISSRTNPLNNYILVDEKYKYFTLHRADGRVRTYKKVHHSKQDYKLLSEHLPNGNWIFYEYEEVPVDKKTSKTLLSRIYTTNPSTDKIYAAADFEYPDPTQSKNFKVQGSDGQTLDYGYQKDRDTKEEGPLSWVLSSKAPLQKFRYIRYKNKDGPQHRLHFVEWPLDREIRFAYYDENETIVAGKKIAMEGAVDPRRNRVKTLYSAKIPTHHFIYHLNKEFDRCTSVYDADHHLTEYLFASDLRLKELKRYGKAKQLITREICLWGDEKIQSKTTYDGAGTILHSTRYIYDKIGNVLEEKLFGNLSGKGSAPILNHLGEPTNQTECYRKRCSYSSGALSLLVEAQEDCGKRVVYDYLPGTDLITSQRTYIQEDLIHSKFFKYNEDHILVQQIEEDGHCRTIKKITPIASPPYFGMPHIIEEFYVEGGKEKFLKKTVLTYTSGGKLTKQEIFGADGRFQKALETLYDEKGRVIAQTNALGEVERFTYDECSNQIQSASKRVAIHTAYDRCNRPIEETLKGDDGKSFSIRFSYDGRHNLISETDPRGNITNYSYDPLGRCTETSLPPIPNQMGILSPSTTHHVYDALGHEITKINPCGHATHTTYNAYGKPTSILYPDGAREEFVYFLDGSLQASIDPLGVTTSYEYDGLKRILSKTVSSRGKILSEERFEYQGLRLSAKIDPEGIRTSYTYNGAGRKIGEECAGEITRYAYDTLGRLCRVIREDQCQIIERDLLDRVIEERTESLARKLYRKLRYEYDASGNKTSITRWIGGMEAKETFHYDSLGRLIQKTDPLGASEWIQINDFCETVLQKTHTDPMGLKTIETYNAQNLLSRIEKGNYVEEKFYHPNGQIHTSQAGKVHTSWIYDCRGRLTACTEAGTKTTQYCYTPRGELAQTIKPSGAVLDFSYDDLGHLISITSSDGTVHHKMAYDRAGNLRAFDGIKRSVDARGRLLSEQFPQGFCVENRFDPLGRRASCHIPVADCFIQYTYDGPNLQSVSKDGYAHTYLDYDLSGHPHRELLIQNRGVIHRSFDPLGRNWKCEAPHFAQEIEVFDPAGNICQMRLQDKRQSYRYDELYQLIEEPNHKYLYDPINNRLEKDGQRYEINPLNQVASHFEYDLNGNPIEGPGVKYTYDALDRLIQVERPDQIITYTYDALHRCLSKRSAMTTYFLYDGLNEIGSLNEALQIQELRILGATPHAEIGAAIAIELQNKIYAPIHDLQGNLATLLPLDDSLPVQYRFSAFGEETMDGSLSCPWRFSSKRVDPDTGLIQFGRRFYHSILGRWMTPDPAGKTDGVNLYAYVHNNPLIHSDEYGLVTFDFKHGWVNCPWGSPYSYTSQPSMQSPVPVQWRQNAFNDLAQLPSINLLQKFSSHYYVSGIQNIPLSTRQGAHTLLNTFGGMANIIPFCSESFGTLRDLLSVVKSKTDPDYSSFAIRRLNRHLQAEILCMDALKDPRKVFVTCFSRGSTDVWHAAKTLSSDMKNRLIITACGPIMALPRDLGFNVTNLISEKDWCSRACNWGSDSLANTYMLPQPHGFKGHFFQNPTYQEGIKNYTEDLYRAYGELK